MRFEAVRKFWSGWCVFDNLDGEKIAFGLKEQEARTFAKLMNGCDPLRPKTVTVDNMQIEPLGQPFWPTVPCGRIRMELPGPLPFPCVERRDLEFRKDEQRRVEKMIRCDHDRCRPNVISDREPTMPGDER